MFYVTKTKECRVKKKKKVLVLSSSLRITDPSLLLKNPRPLSPSQRPRSSYQYPEIDSQKETK